jgi:hypothetical protein
VSARNVQRTRSDRWQSSVATCAALSYSISTNDPSSSTTGAPMPTLVVRLGGGGAQFVVAQAAPPARRPLDQPLREPARAEPEEPPTRIEAEDQPAWPAEVQEQPVPAEVQEEPAREEPEPQFAGEEPEETVPAASNRIELIIDSLSHHDLIEPIPITIDPLGDTVFTASMRNVEIAATGNSIGEALLLLKEQIEATFDELNRQLAHLTQDQKTTLQLLHTYIAPQGRKLQWL